MRPHGCQRAGVAGIEVGDAPHLGRRLPDGGRVQRGQVREEPFLELIGRSVRLRHEHGGGRLARRAVNDRLHRGVALRLEREVLGHELHVAGRRVLRLEGAVGQIRIPARRALVIVELGDDDARAFGIDAEIHARLHVEPLNQLEALLIGDRRVVDGRRNRRPVGLAWKGRQKGHGAHAEHDGNRQRHRALEQGACVLRRPPR
jgi:hypothetical protein